MEKYLAASGCLLALLLVDGVACEEPSNGASKQANVEESGIDIEKNPLSAVAQFAKAQDSLAKKQQELSKRAPVSPVSFQELMTLLPSLDGWTADGEATGETTAMGEFKISNAARSFSKTKGGTSQTMSVTIVDGSYVPMVYAPFMMMSQFSQERSDGYSKGLTVAGYPAFEEWKKDEQSLTLSLLIADRFLVTLAGQGVSIEEGRAWAAAVPIARLKALAQSSTSGAGK